MWAWPAVVRQVAKRVAIGISRILPLNIVPLDAMLRALQKLAIVVSGAIIYRDWKLQASGRPQFFKHQLNLVRWVKEPARWAFVARGVYAREAMFKGCKVLDLCCGDGSGSYLFFADIAGHIDSVDNNAAALAYATRYHQLPNISYHGLDIVRQGLPAAGYDFVVWNAAICYFTKDEIVMILDKIARSGKGSMTLTGMLPRANGWIDHKTEFADTDSVRELLALRFRHVTVKEVSEADSVTFYFSASQPMVMAA
jgi:SAM-dependent methyltransferase